MNGALEYTGLTWDHPRGFEPLDAAARNLVKENGGLRIQWSKQPLEGFESHPIESLAEQYDLVVIDHPCLGEVSESKCFFPMEELFPAEELSGWSKDAVGHSYESYNYQGKQWALPLDAAAQVCALRADIIGRDHGPETWSDVLLLADRYPVALSLSGPHALLTFFSICSGIAGSETRPATDDVFDDHVCVEAYGLLQKLYEKVVKAYLNENPIALLDRMSSGDDIALCPLIYGYVNYSMIDRTGERDLITFVNAPKISKSHIPGSTIGGTGIAVSRGAKITQALLDHIRYLMSPHYQIGFSPDHAGQPSFEKAWRDLKLNEQASQFYLATLDTLHNAWVRPRYPGYVQFQSDGSAMLRAALAEGLPAEETVRRLKAIYHESRSIHSKQKESSHG